MEDYESYSDEYHNTVHSEGVMAEEIFPNTPQYDSEPLTKSEYSFGAHVFSFRVARQFNDYRAYLEWINTEEGIQGRRDVVRSMRHRLMLAENIAAEVAEEAASYQSKDPTAMFSGRPTSKAFDNTFMKYLYRDTSLGGNDALNCYYSFCENDDIIHENTDLDASNARGAQGINGMGRVYAETINANQSILYLSFGLPKFKGIIEFGKDAVDADLNNLMNQNIWGGNVAGFVGSMLGKTVGLVVQIPFIPFKFLGWVASKVQVLMNQEVTKYCDLETDMVTYYAMVNTILAHLAVNMDILDSNATVGIGQTVNDGNQMMGQSPYENARDQAIEMGDFDIPTVYRTGMDMFTIVLKKHMYNENFRKTLRKLPYTTPNLISNYRKEWNKRFKPDGTPREQFNPYKVDSKLDADIASAVKGGGISDIINTKKTVNIDQSLVNDDGTVTREGVLSREFAYFKDKMKQEDSVAYEQALTRSSESENGVATFRDEVYAWADTHGYKRMNEREINKLTRFKYAKKDEVVVHASKFGTPVVGKDSETWYADEGDLVIMDDDGKWREADAADAMYDPYMGYGQWDSLMHGWDAGRRQSSTFIGFRVEKSLDTNESISNSTGQSQLGQYLNTQADQGAQKRSWFNGEIDIPFLQTAKETIGKFMKGMTEQFGYTTIGAVITGDGRLDVPEIWKDSSFNRPYSMNIPLRSPYGDPVSILYSIYVPLACILAGAFPRAIGKNAYTSPFYCSAYCKGILSLPFAIIDNVTIRRGKSQHGWTHSMLPTSIDVSISFKDLSPAMYVALADGSKWYEVLGQNSNFQHYMLTLSGATIADRLFMIHRASRRFRTLKEIFIKYRNSGLRVGMSLSNNTIIGNLATAVSTGEIGEFTASQTNRGRNQLK